MQQAAFRTVRLTFDASDTLLVCKVEDHGAGMSAAVMARIGQPFYTTKAPGSGLGLGMFLVQTIADRISARVRVESAPGKGTIATFEVPRP